MRPRPLTNRVLVLVLLLLAITMMPPVLAFLRSSRSLAGSSSSSSSCSRRRLCMASTSSYATELTVAIQAARRAGLAAKGLQHTLLQSKSAAISKADTSPVTIADFSVQALVVGDIRMAFPQDQVVAEETSTVLRQDPAALAAVTQIVGTEGLRSEAGMTHSVTADDVCHVLDHGQFLGAPRTWILDPIDGTKGFIRGQHFCVALGLALEGVPVLGVLACPNVPLVASRANGNTLGDGCVFFAVKGQGAYVLPLVAAAGKSLAEEIAQATRLHVSDVATGAQARFFESAEAAHSSHSSAGTVTAALGVQAAPVRLDSQCKYGMLSRGEGEIMLRLPRFGYVENIWDHAPAYVVLTEAGGRSTDTEGQPLSFAAGCRTGDGKMDKHVTGIVSTNGKLHADVVKALRSCWPPTA